MRRVFVILPLLIVFALSAPGFAEDEPAAPAAEEPTPLKPATELKAVRLPFDLDDLAPADGARPDGWGPATGVQPKGAPTTSELLRLARAAGVDGDKIAARCIPMTQGEGEAVVHGTLGYLLIGVEASTLTPKLAAAAEKHGWRMKNVAIPSAVLITWASDDGEEAALQTWQTETTVRNLCVKGWEDLTTASQEFDQNVGRMKFARGQARIGAARDTLPEAAYVHAILTQLFARDQARALEHGRKALKAGAPVPMPASMKPGIAFTVAGALLTAGSPADVAEVVTLLRAAIAVEKDAANPIHRFGNRYNLACAYARQEKLDAAFKHLEESLRFLKEANAEDPRLGYAQHFEHARSKDPDMDNLRPDPRFAKLMATYDPSPKPAAAPEKDGN